MRKKGEMKIWVAVLVLLIFTACYSILKISTPDHSAHKSKKESTCGCKIERNRSDILSNKVSVANANNSVKLWMIKSYYFE